ncbi:hypothetical protein AAF712_009769 [Marasmius tenuissimus]|uniref:DUF6535 domain-containing protein n=1 Tax=Marasmius tenuissimus TaxID=585030 RepID=A0ABR2ZQU6_9AGAR
MSSSTTPVRKRTRSPKKSPTPRTQSLGSSTADEPRSPPEHLTPRPVVTDGSQQEGSSGPIGYSETGTKPLDEMDPEVQDSGEALDPISAKEGVLPHATDKDEDESEGEVNTRDTGTKEQTPLDGSKTDNPTGNGDTADGGSNPIKPTLEKSWEVIMKEVTSLDDGLVGGWKEDIDTLLVFAGLFSAVVTAFTIESYQWLQEAPEDTAVTLLRQISQQMNGSTVSQPGPDEFTVSSSVVTINILWFMSLIIALVDALFALLCKQWLREHRRHTHTRTPSDALALRRLRTQSLEKWHVPTILASLPILLEIALFLFLAGLLELLRTRHAVLFKIATSIVVFTALFYLGTTITPTVDIIRQARQVTWELRHKRKDPGSWHSPVDFIMTLPPMEYMCPYKSPQAWAVFQVLRSLSRILLPLYDLERNTMCSISDWSSVDLELLQRSSIDLAPPFYELNAFHWLVSELRDSPHMIPHLRNILSTFPPHLVMPAIFDQWFFLPGRQWAVSDIEAALDPNTISFQGLTRAKDEFLHKKGNTDQFRRLLHWTNVSMNTSNDGGRNSSPPFSTPFETIDAIPDSDLCARLWGIYTEIVQSPTTLSYYLVPSMEDLTPYIIASSPDYALHLPTVTTTSSFVKSAAGHKFISNMHSTIVERGIHGCTFTQYYFNWLEAIDIVRRVHELPEDHFIIPGHFSLPLPKLRKTLNGPAPTDPKIDFGYLGSLSRDWGGAEVWHKGELVEILLGHINYPQSDAKLSHCPGESKISPLVMSSAGLELITFVNNCLAEERETYRYLCAFNLGTGWRDAIERVRTACPKLPPDHFKLIFHEGIDEPPASDERPLQLEAEAEAQAEDSSGSPRDVTDTGEVDRDEQMEGRSDSKPSPQPRPGEVDERGSLFEDAEQGSIPMQPVATANPASASVCNPAQGAMVGGPDADQNV